MDNRPIGVFDSGLGGLTAVKELRMIMPDEKIVYLGDTARAPYGTRTEKNIQSYAVQDAKFLMGKNVKAILIACGTVSSTAMKEVRECVGSEIPVLGVIDASAMKAAGVTENKRIGVLATSATIRSRSYVKKLLEIDPEIDYVEKACPLLVSLVEGGYVDKDDVALNEIIKDYLAGVLAFGADTYILGCTHFPIIKEAIRQHTGRAELIESGKEAAIEMKHYLEEHDMCCEGSKERCSEQQKVADAEKNAARPDNTDGTAEHGDAAAQPGNGSITVYVTERTGNFNKVAEIFMGDVHIDQVEEISFDQYAGKE